jgi:LPS O-antigen subunit length determinant protein (WzzB/FepE family)
MVQVKDKTGRILYTVEKQIRKQPRRRVLSILLGIIGGIVAYLSILFIMIVGAIL